jgi:hypothetical protein
MLKILRIYEIMCAFSIPRMCCMGCNFFQCVSLSELNPWKDEWLICIEALQQGKKKLAKKVAKKRKKQWSSLLIIH